MLDIEDHDGVIVVRLRHGKVNALDLEVVRAVTAAVRDVESGRALVITGGGSCPHLGVPERGILLLVPVHPLLGRVDIDERDRLLARQHLRQLEPRRHWTRFEDSSLDRQRGSEHDDAHSRKSRLREAREGHGAEHAGREAPGV